MTETILVSVIMCICSGLHNNNNLKKHACLETYVNCSVGKNGVILDKKEFINKCNFTIGAEKCLK